MLSSMLQFECGLHKSDGMRVFLIPFRVKTNSDDSDGTLETPKFTSLAYCLPSQGYVYIAIFVPHERFSHEDVYIEMGQSSHTQRGGAFVKTCAAATSKTNVVLSFLEAPEGDHKV